MNLSVLYFRFWYFSCSKFGENWCFFSTHFFPLPIFSFQKILMLILEISTFDYQKMIGKMIVFNYFEHSCHRSVFVNYLLVRWFCFEVFHHPFVVVHKTDFWNDPTVLICSDFYAAVLVWIPLLSMVQKIFHISQPCVYIGWISG